jgi:hypothetical protein
MENIKVRLFGPGGCDWNGHFLSWNYQKPTYENIELVWDDTYTHAGLFGIPRIPLNIPKSNVIGIQCEPYELLNIPSYYDYIQKHIGTYYTSDPGRFTQPEFKRGVTYFGTVPVAEIQDSYEDFKLKKMCIVASAKQHLVGHRLRHQIIQRILQSDLNIDIYGRGIEHMYKDPRVKGSLESKEEIYKHYKYAIAIENVFYGFATEKICDPILFDALPIYAGHPDQPFMEIDNEFHLTRTNNIDDMFNMIRKIYEDDTLYEKYKSRIIEAKRNMLEVKNTLPEFLYKVFNEL